MIGRAIRTLIAAALLYLLYLLASQLVQGTILLIVGVVLLLIFIGWALKEWGISF